MILISIVTESDATHPASLPLACKSGQARCNGLKLSRCVGRARRAGSSKQWTNKSSHLPKPNHGSTLIFSHRSKPRPLSAPVSANPRTLHLIVSFDRYPYLLLAGPKQQELSLQPCQLLGWGAPLTMTHLPSPPAPAPSLPLPRNTECHHNRDSVQNAARMQEHQHKSLGLRYDSLRISAGQQQMWQVPQR